MEGWDWLTDAAERCDEIAHADHYCEDVPTRDLFDGLDHML